MTTPVDVDAIHRELLNGRTEGRGFTPPAGHPCARKGCITLTLDVLCERHLRQQIADNLIELAGLVQHPQTTGSFIDDGWKVRGWALDVIDGAYRGRTVREQRRYLNQQKEADRAAKEDARRAWIEARPHQCLRCPWKRYKTLGRLAQHAREKHSGAT